MRSSALWLIAVIWTARLLALGLFFLWGAFFVEHVREWYLNPAKGFPPAWVSLQMLAHLAFLIGLLALWRWELAGSLLTMLGALAFFGGLGVMEKMRGHSYGTFLLFLAVTIVPALLTLCCWFARTHLMSPANTPLSNS